MNLPVAGTTALSNHLVDRTTLDYAGAAEGASSRWQQLTRQLTRQHSKQHQDLSSEQQQHQHLGGFCRSVDTGNST